MKTILKIIVVLFLGLVGLRFYLVQRATENAPPPAGAITRAPGPSPYGFTPIPLSGLPSDRVCVIAPQYCSSAEGRRADEITQQLTAEGIPCQRVSSVSVSFDHEPTKAEIASSDQIMKGPVPIIYINGKARNSPDTADVIGEFRSSVH